MVFKCETSHFYENGYKIGTYIDPKSRFISKQTEHLVGNLSWNPKATH